MIHVYHNNSWTPLAGKKIYHNGSWITLRAADKIYAGGVWHDLEPVPLCLTAQAANSTVSIEWIDDTGESTPLASLYYRTASTPSWTAYTLDTVIPLASVGDWVEFKNTSNVLSSLDNHYHFVLTGQIAASGNIMSMIAYGRLYNRTFLSLFAGNSALVAAPELPATRLDVGCYANMFAGTSITTAPALPATEMANLCYGSMFESCPYLTSVSIHANALKTTCCYYMCKNCSSINSVTVDFSSWNDNDHATDHWLDGVSSSGTFTCPSALPDIRDVNHIPSGWTVVRT